MNNIQKSPAASPATTINIADLKNQDTQTLALLAADICANALSDPGLPFENYSLAVLYYLKAISLPEWTRVRASLKVNKAISITTLEKQLADYGKPSLRKPDHLDLAKIVLNEIGRINLIYINKEFIGWNGRGKWVAVNDSHVRKIIHRTLTRKCTGTKINKPLIDGVIDCMKTESYRPNHHFNTASNCINVENGELYYEKRKWVLKKPVLGHYMTIQLPVVYDPKAKAPQFITFLNSIFKDDKQANLKKKLLLQCMGCTLLMSSQFEIFIMLIGFGANGKSVFLAILKKLLGVKNCAAVQPSQFDNRFQRAHLQHKLANIVSELKAGASIDDDILKSITSGEATTVEKKFQDPFEFEPFSTCWFGTNHLPQTNDCSGALHRRAIIVPFNRTFTPKEQDKKLKSKLAHELPGILNLALDGLASLLDNNQFITVDEVVKAAEQWRIENDQVSQFIEDCCILNPKLTCPSATIYAAYQAWSADSGIYRKLQKNELSNKLRIHGIMQEKIAGKRCLTGIDIRR